LLGETASWQLAHRVVTSWADDLDVDVMPPTVTGWLLALAGELGEHLVEPAAVRAHAEHVMQVLAAAPPGKRQRAEPSQTYRRWIDAQRLRCELLPLVEAFTARKRAERAVDFADQLAIAARVAEAHPEVGEVERATFRAVLLDEYQDTGHSQRVLLRALFGTAPGGPARPGGPAVTAVGDPCQSIYGWRGASAGNLVRFRTDFPGPDGPADEYGLLTSFRNPPEVLALANAVSAPLREAPGAVGVGALRAGPGAGTGHVRVALLPDVAAEITWLADGVAARWEQAGEAPPTTAVLVRRRADMDAVATALRARGLPVEVVGLGGLLDTPEVRDLVSALRLIADPLSGPAAVRLLTGARWRLGVADLAALWQRAREVVPGAPTRPGPLSPAELALGALPGEQAEQAGLVDALDDPGPAARYSLLGYARIRRLARELRWLRSRASAPLTDLVADAERVLLLDAETAARPGPVGRAHLDAFADVVADFATGAEVATLPALLDYLETAERAEDGLSPGEVEVSTDRVQVLTVHAAKGLEWQVVAVPHLVSQVFPGRKIGGTWLTSPAELPVALRGDAADLPGLDLPADADRKQLEDGVKEHSAALDERRLVEERRLFYVALTRAERVLLVSGHRWGAAGDKPRQPSEFLVEVARAHPPEHWADEPGPDDVNPALAEQPTASWPADPLGDRSADVHAGADLVLTALRDLDRARPEATDAAAPGPQLDRLGVPGETVSVPVGQTTLGTPLPPPDLLDVPPVEEPPDDDEIPPPDLDDAPPPDDADPWTAPGRPSEEPLHDDDAAPGDLTSGDRDAAARPVGPNPSPRTQAHPSPGGGDRAGQSDPGGGSPSIPAAPVEGDRGPTPEPDRPGGLPGSEEGGGSAARATRSHPGAGAVRSSSPTTGAGRSGDDGPDPWPGGSAVPPEEELPPEDDGDPEGWAADVEVLLAERAAARTRPTVALPAQLSVSQLVELAADPAALAARLRRPLPMAPSPHARRGTAFHAWLEQRFGAVGLLDLDDLPGAADEGAGSDDALEELQEAYLASVWASGSRLRSRCRSRRCWLGWGCGVGWTRCSSIRTAGSRWSTGRLVRCPRSPACRRSLCSWRCTGWRGRRWLGVRRSGCGLRFTMCATTSRCGRWTCSTRTVCVPCCPRCHWRADGAGGLAALDGVSCTARLRPPVHAWFTSGARYSCRVVRISGWTFSPGRRESSTRFDGRRISGGRAPGRRA
jgi:DNA helicase-2/ATP-dependent DNA helicase PcrA